MDKYVLLAGAKRNAGDFLIVYRAKKLLRMHNPQIEFLELTRWKPLDGYLEEVNSARAIILCGGPAYQPNFYPGIYPLVGDLNKIKVPIIPFGLGWKGFPGDETTVQRYTFTPSSLKLLRKIHDSVQMTSCRDYLTKRILTRHRFNNVVMTGDPAWYDLAYIGKSFVPPSRIDTIIVSAPAQDIYHQQSIDLAVALRELFRKAEIICAFHHGWEASEYVPSRTATAFRQLRVAFERHGFQPISLAGDLRRMEDLYSNADLHVGYRLHAHLFFLSQRKPSFLLEEDGRGRGASEALGLRGIQAWSRSVYDPLITKIPNIRYVRGFVKRILGPGVVVREHAVDDMIAFIEGEFDNGFSRFKGLGETLDSYYTEAMVPFLQSLP